MRIVVASIFVADQEHALQFYTETLGFQKKTDVPTGEYRWLTVVSTEAPDGTELLLEPNVHPAALAFQQAIFADGIPATTLFVSDVQAEFERLQGLDVRFTMEPTLAGTVKLAVFDDTCGNLIMIVEE